ncbi:MAG: lipid-binding SYLF domain-containing protein [Planctomycetes bacterium]|nr:lipid-binding SYLF domain-containing protein [Planctomycetota bacterium]
MTKLHLRIATFACLALAACATAPRSAEGKADIVQEADATLARAQERDSHLASTVRSAAGCAVFPKIGKAAIGVGGAYGKGVLYENGKMVGYCDMSQATVGLQLGGQTYTEIICFDDKTALKKFKHGDFAFDAQASTAAMEAGSGANTDYAEGVDVFTLNEAGMMAEASVGGQKFSYKPAH